MLYYSTRDRLKKVTLSQAISLGLAEDGGLFMPERFPQIDLSKLSPQLSYSEFSSLILKDFFAGDLLEPYLDKICKNAFNFPVPLTKLNENTEILELYHGPTLSFKDFGAQFLAECMNELAQINENKKITIMVATSGDTGSAVANAFYKKSNVNVVVLFPKGQISKRQEQQITCYDDNVIAIAVDGTFDSCQKIVKEAFSNSWWQNVAHISSANSINLGRLLPQMTYYAYTSYKSYLKTNEPVNLIIPTGNLGNATAAYFARMMGFPIAKIVLSTNANKVIPDFVNSGIYAPKPSTPTLANAMDVGNPSNFERLHDLYTEHKQFIANVSAYSVNDEQIKQTIKEIYDKYKMIICPHTATGLYVRNHCLTGDDKNKSWVVVSTAHPGKFETVIEPILGIHLTVPENLSKILNKPSKSFDAKASVDNVYQITNRYFFNNI